MTTPSRPPAARRPLPPARLSNPNFEIVHKRLPETQFLFRDLFAAVSGGLSWSAELLGAAYAGAARSALERKEALQDLNAERRAASRPAARTHEAPHDGAHRA
ncbi:hypothetical protein ACFQI3_16310 [Hansschlegelia quercus]|uniref:Uncharacterized protein n=1 Tax=Hansschlegelia quercus TaxID=2528245 RepID=A0A4Q9GMR8_9HYPH|nr:hypothetical protein [Hansschlegelia quercus]TBN52493.1 hypothetical protein EYR15_11710 [Hansschlegelia quercus]